MRAAAFGVLSLCVLSACTPKKAPPAGGSLPREECLEKIDGVLCSDDGHALTCLTQEVADDVDCKAQDLVCLGAQGCVACRPGERSCDGNDVTACRKDGTGFDLLEECGDDVVCSPQGCRDLCAQALADRSYIGCEYYPVFTSNAFLDALFQPAVVIANPNLVEARVTITRADSQVAEARVPALGVETVMLKFVAPLRTPRGSGIVRNGAYHLVSSVPVTVHQFNPLLFEIEEDCKRRSIMDTTSPHRCNSLSNDASLLLPAHVLERGPGEGTAYLAVSRASMLTTLDGEQHTSAGFITVVGAGAGPVHVNVKSSAYTVGKFAKPMLSAAGDEPAEMEALAALAPGEMLSSVTLGPGDVLQLLASTPTECPVEMVKTRSNEMACPLGPEYDLTGTSIEADGPIEVIGGHNCAYVPFDRIACDHLEEIMFPLETWSVEVVAARPRAGDALPHVVRVLSAADGNVVTFDPPEVQAPVTLGRAESFEIETTEHVVIRADKPIMVAQYLVGQNGESRVGDPSLSIAIPTEQYRSQYAFLSPDTYDLNYVSLIARTGDRVILDNVEVTEFVTIGDGEFAVAAVKLARSGAHEVHSFYGQAVGVVIYGYGDYTSYMLPGGLDLRVIGTVY